MLSGEALGPQYLLLQMPCYLTRMKMGYIRCMMFPKRFYHLLYSSFTVPTGTEECCTCRIILFPLMSSIVGMRGNNNHSA